MMGPELHVDLLRDERNSICALRLRYIVYEHGHYALFFIVYSTRIIHFFVPLLSVFYA